MPNKELELVKIENIWCSVKKDYISQYTAKLASFNISLVSIFLYALAAFKVRWTAKIKIEFYCEISIASKSVQLFWVK